MKEFVAGVAVLAVAMTIKVWIGIDVLSESVVDLRIWKLLDDALDDAVSVRDERVNVLPELVAEARCRIVWQAFYVDFDHAVAVAPVCSRIVESRVSGSGISIDVSDGLESSLTSVACAPSKANRMKYGSRVVTSSC